MSERKTLNHKIAQDAGWNEADHPRGQPENKGEFASGSGGASSKPPAAKANPYVEKGNKTQSNTDPSIKAQLATLKPGETLPKGQSKTVAEKYGGGESFMHPTTKSGAENSPLAALRKHVTGSVESGKSEPIEGKPAGGEKSPQLQEYEALQKHANETHMHPAEFQSKTDAIQHGGEVGAIKTAIQGAVKEGKAFSGGEAARQQVLNNGISHAHHEIGDHVSYGNGKGGKIINLTNTHAVIQQPEGAGHSAPDTVPLEQITANHAKENAPKTNPEWKYKDATGVERTGHVKATREGQGSDVTYTFQRADGSGIDVVSGSRLKEAKTTGRVIPVGAAPTATDPDSPEQIAKFKNGTESLRDRMSRSAETYKPKAKDEQPGMVTQPNSGGVPFKGRNLDDDPVGDRSMPAPDCGGGGAGWPGRVL
jgi:hypothetical protein